MNILKHRTVLIILLVLFSAVVFNACAVGQKSSCGCPSKKGMSGY